MWTAGFVLLTLIVNAPLLPWVLRITGLSKGTTLCLACHWPLNLGSGPGSDSEVICKQAGSYCGEPTYQIRWFSRTSGSVRFGDTAILVAMLETLPTFKLGQCQVVSAC